MKLTLTLATTITLFSLFTVSCQTAQTTTKRTETKPTPAKPLPAWTKSGGKASDSRSDKQILITTKIIEITRPATEAAPSKPYTKKLTDTEFQTYIRGLSQKKGTDLMSTPSVVTRDGQLAKVEIIKEFVYPLTPGEKPKFGTENTGVTSHFLARATKDGKKIDLKSLTDVTEFEGFNEVSPGFDQPVFNRRRIESSTELADGQTYIHGGYVSEDEQNVVDTTLGIFKKTFTEKFTRELIVIVSPTFIDPAGKPIVSAR
jgi:type II secretory pathway component GspD/PulD (secretin)